MSTQQEFKNTIIFTLLEKFNRQHTFEELTDEVIERIKHMADTLCGNDEEVKEPTKSELPLDTKLLDLNFRGPLIYHVSTVGELIQHTPIQLLKIRNFGKKSLLEVENFLEKHNLKLKGR